MSSNTSADLAPLPRCCDRHDDWQTLADHLVRDFPSLGPEGVVRELDRAKQAVASFGLSGTEDLAVAELMTRHQLMLLNGDVPDIARLDPERHLRSDGAA